MMHYLPVYSLRTVVLPLTSSALRGSLGKKGFGNRPFSTSYLPAGTLVKHGTTSDVLSSIRSNGICSSGTFSAGMLRDAWEKKATTSGVYVAESFPAYSSALISFSYKIALMMHCGYPVEPDLIPIPIVLNIRLQEDCMFKADEDYVGWDKEVRKATGKVGNNKTEDDDIWNKFGSASILRERGIPPDWIESIECPHVLHPLDVEKAFGFLDLNPMDPSFNGRWDLVPVAIDREEQFGRSMQAIMDDMFKFVYAYADLTPPAVLESMSLKEAFESMKKVEFLSGSPAPHHTVYVTPSSVVVHGRSGLSPSSVVANGRSGFWQIVGLVKVFSAIKSGDVELIAALSSSPSTNIETSLTGTPKDWEALDPNTPGLRWFEAEQFNEWTNTRKQAELKAGYATLLFLCAQHTLARMGAPTL